MTYFARFQVSKLRKFPSSPNITLKYVAGRILRRQAEEEVIENLLKWIQIVCTIIMEDTEFIKKWGNNYNIE